MNVRKTTIAAVMAAAVVATATATAGADAPAPAPGSVSAPQAQGVHYDARIEDKTVVATLADGGTFVAAGDSISVRDAAGRTLESLPLSFSFDGERRPIRQEISADGSTLRLTPDVAGLVVRPQVKAVATPLENQLAMNDLINAAAFGLTIGSLVGTVIGTVLGAGVGFVLAGASCVVLSLGCVVAVLPIMALVAGVGGIIGLDIGGAGGVIPAALNYVNTLNAPPGQSIYASQIPALAGNAPGAPQPAPQPAP
ncbi:hypothetical protein [Nocardia cerradoensis]|uniref:DUF8020 domain-containing protein n=1 Tax=Nocardia cerradoensis TaxID=85688 RepID=A0A231GUI7_9NOCA|nr:hypothetical protein [Nocardia cerradoensis]NKY43716.1 hypothetical protein [Nocardia cerradoensis]OXR40141.1 hypothetical protein B7C42_07805 [Nocardia cerradoensis]